MTRERVAISEHARENMRLMHVSEKQVRSILRHPEVDYEEAKGKQRSEANRRIAQAGEVGVVYVPNDDGSKVVVTVLKRSEEEWTRRKKP